MEVLTKNPRFNALLEEFQKQRRHGWAEVEWDDLDWLLGIARKARELVNYEGSKSIELPLEPAVTFLELRKLVNEETHNARM